MQCSRRLTGGLCSGLIPCSPTNVRRLALALLLLPVVSHPPPEHRLLLRCGRRFGTYRDADHPLVGVKVGRRLGAVDVDWLAVALLDALGEGPPAA